MTTLPVISTTLPALANIGDPDGTRTVTSIVVLLVALGVALLLLAVWIFRTTRPDPELLAPLEAMGERSWRRGDPVWQRRRLDELRPKGARPLTPSVAPPKLDAAFDAGPAAPGFDDLRTPTPLERREDAEPGVQADDDQTDVDATSGFGDEVGPDSTPSGVPGPTLDEFPDDEFDPDALAAAEAELERELAESRESSAEQQLDVFYRDPRS